jgi:hypothetical protein
VARKRSRKALLRDTRVEQPPSAVPVLILIGDLPLIGAFPPLRDPERFLPALSVRISVDQRPDLLSAMVPPALPPGFHPITPKVTQCHPSRGPRQARGPQKARTWLVGVEARFWLARVECHPTRSPRSVSSVQISGEHCLSDLGNGVALPLLFIPRSKGLSSQPPNRSHVALNFAFDFTNCQVLIAAL